MTDSAAGFIDTTVDGVAIADTAATVLTGHLARAAGETVAGGPYAITQGTLAADSNYTMTFTGNTLTITPATLTITADPETKVFGSADPTLAYTSSGFQFSDTAATVLTGHLARAAGETVSGSPYAIGQGTLAANSNYTINFTGSSLSITAATPMLTVSDPGGTYTGTPIAATATVTGAGGTAAASLEGVTPTLTYYAGSGTSGTNLGSTAPSAAGTYTVVASFPGSADYAAAQSQPTTFVIVPGSATLTLTSSGGSAVYGQAVTFVATVSSGGTPGGAVTFSDDGTPLATVPLDGSGQAALTISTLALGSNAITATYNSNGDSLSAKSGAVTESVSQAATAIVLVPHPIKKGKKKLEAVGLTVEIKPAALGGGVPTGQVTFEFVTKHGKKVQRKTLGTAALVGGEATLTFKPNQVLKQASDDRLQRRSRLPGQHDESAQIDGEGAVVAQGRVAPGDRIQRIPLLIGSWSAKLPDIASGARRDAVVQIHLVRLVVLTCLGQVNEERRPIPAPRPASLVIAVRGWDGGKAETRRISLIASDPLPRADEEGEPPPTQVPIRLNLNSMVVERENFDHWLFSDDRSDSQHWERLEKQLESQVDSARTEHTLTDRQCAKLRLAGKGDIKRFFDRVESSRLDFEVQRQSFRTGHAALLRLESLSQNYREGPFGDGSLFAKNLRRMNDERKIHD